MAFRTLNSITHVALTLAPVDGLGWARVKHQALVGNSGDTLAAGLYLSIVLQHSDTETDGNAERRRVLNG